MVKCDEGNVEIVGTEDTICAEVLTLVRILRERISENALSAFDEVLADFIKLKAVKEDNKIIRLVKREGE